MKRSVRRIDDETWIFGENERRWSRDYQALIIHRADLDECTGTDLKAALRRAEAAEYGVAEILITEVEERFMDDTGIPFAEVQFAFDDDELALKFTYVNEDPNGEVTEEAMEAALLPLLQQHRVQIASLSRSDFSYGAWIWDVSLTFSTRNRVLRSLFDAAEDLLALMTAVSTGQLTRETAGQLVRAGRADILIGQPEGHWLEAKSQHYDLSSAGGQISLAQAVSRFCNSEQGGLVIVGIRTKKTVAGEEIRGLSPMPHDSKVLRRYSQVLEHRLFPPPDNLQIDAVTLPDGTQMMLLDIPPQPEELKPFLVHGAIVDGREEGAFISIVRRRGEGSIPVTAPMIHSTLAAGRALLRRGHLPN